MQEQSEANTLNAIIDFLEAKKYLYLRHNPLKPIIRRKQIAFAPLRPSQRGAPDLILFLPGGVAAMIEIKSQKGMQSEDQMEWERRCYNNGFKYHLVRSVDQVIKICERHCNS